MKVLRTLLASLTVVTGLGATGAHAALINGSFEDGLAGWTTIGAATATEVNPSEGNFAALIATSINSNVSSFAGTSVPGWGGSGIQQTFTHGGGLLSFWWDFQTFEAVDGTFGDAAYLVINGVATMIADASNKFMFTDPGDSYTGMPPYTFFESKTGYRYFEMPVSAGTSTISFIITDVGNDAFIDSGLFIDRVMLVSNQEEPVPVPAPGILLLMGAGLLALSVMRRRRVATISGQNSFCQGRI